MCIIVAKNRGVKLPSKETFENCFENNGDGAGIMWLNPRNNKVIIDKGYMSFRSFWRHINHLSRTYNLDEIPMVFHFRIGTDGVRQNQANTHPFAIKRDLKSLTKPYLETQLAVAHNGIISDYKGDSIYSDTQHFISEYLFDLYKTNKTFYKNPNLQRAIELLTNSKFAFLDTTGDITLIGHFIEDEGVMYSNTTYSYTYSYPAYDYTYNSPYVYKKYEDENYSEFCGRKRIPYGYSLIIENGDLYYYVGKEDMFYINVNGDVYDESGSYSIYMGTDAQVYDEYGRIVDLFEV